MAELKPCPFAVGDTVYILGKFAISSYATTVLIEATISHTKGRRFVAYTSGSNYGTWVFSSKHYNKCVFKDRKKAMETLSARQCAEQEG